VFVNPHIEKTLDEQRKKGRATSRVKDIFLDSHHMDEKTGKTLSSRAAEMLATQAKIIKLARMHQQELDARHFSERSLKASESEFEPGSYVLEEYPATGLRRGAAGPGGKQKPTLQGPLRVASKRGHVYTLQNLVTGRRHEFRYDPARTDPREAALRDNNEFVVERILRHRVKEGGRKGVRTHLEFLVKWLGYAEASSEPRECVRLVDKLHDYPRDNKLKSLRPKTLNLRQVKARARRTKCKEHLVYGDINF
jgi:hypothetical protein